MDGRVEPRPNQTHIKTDDNRKRMNSTKPASFGFGLAQVWPVTTRVLHYHEFRRGFLHLCEIFPAVGIVIFPRRDLVPPFSRPVLPVQIPEVKGAFSFFVSSFGFSCSLSQLLFAVHHLLVGGVWQVFDGGLS